MASHLYGFINIARTNGYTIYKWLVMNRWYTHDGAMENTRLFGASRL